MIKSCTSKMATFKWSFLWYHANLWFLISSRRKAAKPWSSRFFGWFLPLLIGLLLRLLNLVLLLLLLILSHIIIILITIITIFISHTIHISILLIRYVWRSMPLTHIDFCGVSYKIFESKNNWWIDEFNCYIWTPLISIIISHSYYNSFYYDFSIAFFII